MYVLLKCTILRFFEKISPRSRCPYSHPPLCATSNPSYKNLYTKHIHAILWTTDNKR